jgi:hypothetical protein
LADLQSFAETFMDALDAAIREFTPDGGDWRPLETLFERAFSTPDPKPYYHAIFGLFERFPEDDGSGVFWSALHGIEAAGGYEDLLLQYFHRHPSLMTSTMLRRIRKSGQTHIGHVEIASLVA